MNAKQEITDLTICRAFFAAWVFAYHVDLHANFSACLGPFAGLIRRGYLGVDGFFLLSGLILARVHPELGKSSKTAWRFWVKRLARIYPVHLATILILLAIVAAGTSLGLAPRDASRFSISALWQNLLLIQGWGFGDTLAWNYPSWSVSAEWAGYLLFPAIWLGLFAAPIYVTGQIAVLCVPLLGFLAYQSGHGLNITSSWVLARFFLEFIWGIASALLVPVFADALPTAILALAGFAITAVSVVFVTNIFAVIGLWLVIISFAMQADAERPPVFKLPLLRRLGLLSYAFYMSFGISELLLAQMFRHLNLDPAREKLIYAAAMTGLTFLIAILLHIIVENPCRRLADRWLNPRPKPEIIPPAKRPLAATAKRL